MFFSWLNKNKKFDLRKELSGQITPFLVVALVILLIAAIATINIGRVSLDKTCSANAADAGSLAAASVWASAFNSLTEINRDQIEFWYDVNFYTYGELYKESQEHIDAAIIAALESSALAASAAAIGTDYSQCYSIWYAGIAVAALDAAAGTLALEASMEVMAFNMTVMYMQSRITDPFHDQQWSNYQYARDFMDKSYINARKTGLSYAFSNSCIPPKLSDSQNDAFSAWMMQEGPFNEGREEASSYSWEDKIPQTHTVT
ncbi:MAG: pilus assembly protein TadG-related protein, partial [Candidatus Omnitrophota bacterium]